MRIRQVNNNRFFVSLLIFAVIAVAIVSLHTYHFEDHAYRQDEAWVVHGVMLNSPYGIMEWSLWGTSPPAYTLMMKGWVSIFGHNEAITRFNSTLITLLTLALVFRLTSDLFDYRVGLLAVFLLGTLPFFQFYTHEVRPYPLLIAATVGAQWALLRWLRKPSGRYALLFVFFGILTLYLHLYGMFMMAALALFCLIFVRWDRQLLIRGVGLFAAVGIAFLPWFVAFIQNFVINQRSGIVYALGTEASDIGENVAFLYDKMQIHPAPIGTFLLILGFIIPLVLWNRDERQIFRFNIFWRRIFLIAIPVLVLLIAFTTNAFIDNLTSRNLVVILPSMAIMSALALYSLGWRAQWILIVFIAIAAWNEFTFYDFAWPYNQISDYIGEDYQANTAIVVNVPSPVQQIPLMYYLRERMPVHLENADVFSFVASVRLNPTIPDPAVNSVKQMTDDAIPRFEKFLEGEPVVWYIDGYGGMPFSQPFVDILNENYLAYTIREFVQPFSRFSPYIVTQYRRIPDDLHDLFIFGDQFALQNWTLKDSVEVQPCQTITLDSWWESSRPLTTDYSLTLVMANAEGIGVSRTDSAPAGILTTRWQPDQLYLDERALTIPCDVQPGEYPLLIGLYEPKELVTLPITTPEGAPVGEQIYLTTLFVK